MPYPFLPGVRDMDDTSWKLKVLSVASGIPITKTMRQAIDFVWDQVERQSPHKLERAKRKVGDRKEYDRVVPILGTKLNQ